VVDGVGVDRVVQEDVVVVDAVLERVGDLARDVAVHGGARRSLNEAVEVDEEDDGGAGSCKGATTTR